MSICNIEDHTFLSNNLSPQSVVLDLGANRGRFSREIIKRFQCRCFAIEANPELCRAIDPQSPLTVRNLAMAGVSGLASLHIGSNCESSTIVGEARPSTIRTVEVRTATLEELVEQEGLDNIHLIKMDIEGAEIAMLDACSDEFLMRIPQMTIEFHDFQKLTPRPVVEKVIARLRKLGFFYISWWRNAYGDTLFINRRLCSASYAECLWAKYVVRNWRGLRRVAARMASSRRGRENASFVVADDAQ